MTTICPCCGGPAPAALRVLRGHSALARGGVLVRHPSRVVSLAALLQLQPRTARNIAHNLLGLILQDTDDIPSLVFVYISQLRRALAPLRVAVELRAGRYHLVEN